MNSFSSFYYIAFIAANFEWNFPGSPDLNIEAAACAGYSDCMEALQYNLLTVLLSALIVSNGLEYFLFPLTNWAYSLMYKLYLWLPKYFSCFKSFGVQVVGKEFAQKEENLQFRKAIMQFYERGANGDYEITELIAEYSELFVLFGYLILFLPAAPIAALIGFLSVAVEIHGDLFKLSGQYLRPFPQGAQDIGSWQGAFQLVAYLAVPTNAGLVVFTMDILGNSSILTKFIVFIFLQYIMFGVILIATSSLSVEPEKVTVQRARNVVVNRSVARLKTTEAVDEKEAQRIQFNKDKIALEKAAEKREAKLKEEIAKLKKNEEKLSAKVDEMKNLSK